MQTSPLNVSLSTTSVTRANLANGVPPGAQHGVGPKDGYTQGELAAPPLTYTAPAAAAEEARPRSAMKGWVLGLLGLTVGAGLAIGLLGPANSAATHTANQPVAAVTVKDTSQADLKAEVGKAQYGVALRSSAIDTELPASGSFGVSADYAQIGATNERTEANGFSFEVHGQQLITRGGTADQVAYDTREGQIPQYVQSFYAEAEDNWSFNSQIRPAGGAGTYVSIASQTEIYTGGSPNQSVELMTFDHVEGNRVMLSDLLSPQQHTQINNTVHNGLNSAAAGQLFGHDNLNDIVNRSFSLNDKGGKDLELTVAVPGNTEANEARVATFTFSVPRDILK